MRVSDGPRTYRKSVPPQPTKRGPFPPKPGTSAPQRKPAPPGASGYGSTKKRKK